MTMFWQAAAEEMKREQQKVAALADLCHHGLTNQQAEDLFEKLWEAATRQITPNWEFTMSYVKWASFRLSQGYTFAELSAMVDGWFR